MINKINPEVIKILKLIIYFKKQNIEKSFLFKTNKEKKGYFVKTEFLDKIKNLQKYKIIDDFINKQIDIKKIINDNFDMNIEELSKNICEKFDLQTINLINNEKQEINIKCTAFDINLKKISLNKYRYISYANKCIILSEEIYDIFKGYVWSDNYSKNYLLGENKILIINNEQNTILLYNIDDKNELNLNLILIYDKDKNDILSQIKEYGFNKFMGYLLFNNDTISPIFDNNQNKIGMAYKYPFSKNDIIDYNLIFKIRKIFALYFNYRKLNKEKNNYFNDYALINKNYIENYKKYLNFDGIYKEMEKMTYNLDAFYDDENKNFISDKKLTLLIKILPKKVINTFVEREMHFEKYENSVQKAPLIYPLEYLDKDENKTLFFYYNNFELINTKIYKYLFQNVDKYINTNFFGLKRTINNDVEYAKCLFDKKRILIKLDNNPNNDNKYYLYIGQINSSFSFDIESILIYENINLMNGHIHYIINSKGFNDLCEEFMNLPINKKELEINNKIYGLIVKKNQNPDWDFKYIDNDFISKYFKFAPKVGLDRIKSCIYLNPILQCLCQIEEFASYFKYNSYVNEVIKKYRLAKKNCLTEEFKLLIENLWPNSAIKIDSNKRHFSPNEFWQKLSLMNPSLKNSQSIELIDLINFIIMTLHKELNQKTVGNNININNNNNKKPNDLFDDFYQDYQKNYHSKISELFYSIQTSQVRCSNCNYDTFNFLIKYILVFSLEEIKNYLSEKMPINSINNSLNQNNMNHQLLINNFNNNNLIPIQNANFNQNINHYKITILDCFDYFQKIELLKDNNPIFCGCCNIMSNALLRCTLTKTQKILIICFDRKKELNTNFKLEYYEFLDLSKYVIEQYNQNNKYKLIGIISAKDDIGKNENFIAHCLSPIDYQWYTYNDSNVNRIDDFQKEVIEGGIPHLLVYKKIE